jgi:hypothetical protein
MSQLAVWKILEEMTIELRKKNVEVPANILSDLRAAKSMLKISQTEPGSGEIAQKIEECLSNVEAYVAPQMQKTFGTEAADGWFTRLEEASCETPQTQQGENNFITGVARDQKWVRVEPILNLPAAKLEQLAKELNLSVKVQQDGKLLVYGKPEDIKGFIQKMTKLAAK